MTADIRKWKIKHLCSRQAFRKLPSLVSLGLECALRQNLVCRKAQRLWASKKRPNWNSVSHRSFSASLLLLEGRKLLHPCKGHSLLLQAAEVLSLPPAWTSPTHPPLVLTRSCRTAKSRPWQLLVGTSQPSLEPGCLTQAEALPKPHTALQEVGTNPDQELELNYRERSYPRIFFLIFTQTFSF